MVGHWINEKLDTALFRLDCRGIPLDCTPGQRLGAHVMAILNVTPDSFSDGGRYPTVDAALHRAEQVLAEGAVILDIGGESTRPKGRAYGRGAATVGEVEELRRILPVVKAISARFPELILSVDTYKPGVARAALEAGAHMINDVTGLRLYPEMARIAAEYEAPVVVMHALGKPGEMPQDHVYQDVLEEVSASLRQSIEAAEAAGVKDIITDPGFGFGKTPDENLRLMANTHRLLSLGRPVLVGLSRKNTIGAILSRNDLPRPVDERLFGTLGATAVAVFQGASIVRTHDVIATVDLLRLLGTTAALIQD